MNTATRREVAKALGVTPLTFTRKVVAGLAPLPVSGQWPTTGKPRAEAVPMWDMDACLRAWGRM